MRRIFLRSTITSLGSTPTTDPPTGAPSTLPVSDLSNPYGIAADAAVNLSIARSATPVRMFAPGATTGKSPPSPGPDSSAGIAVTPTGDVILADHSMTGSCG